MCKRLLWLYLMVDGWNDDTNGSVVGHTDSPFAEQEIVHGGGQSLVFQYDNSGTATFSEGVVAQAAFIEPLRPRDEPAAHVSSCNRRAVYQRAALRRCFPSRRWQAKTAN
ncbi:MAG: hypothetical protein ABFD90_11830 [Phycisphaerales bacterium]